MPTRITNDPNHWRDRAAKMRELARTMTDAQSAILMNDLAADYDKLAESGDQGQWEKTAAEWHRGVMLTDFRKRAGHDACSLRRLPGRPLLIGQA